MNERPSDIRHMSRSGEAMRSRMQVFVGPRGSFDEEKRQAFKEGAETIDLRAVRTEPAISSVSSMNKRSHQEYTVCTGLAVSARTRDGGRISFVTHQIPTGNPESIAAYEQKITARLQDLIAASVPGTLDAVFFGGEVGTASSGDPDAERVANRNTWYNDMRGLMGGIVRNNAGVEMRIGDGPNLPGEHVTMFLDNDEAKLYIERE